jgi:hypothetical protein
MRPARRSKSNKLFATVAGAKLACAAAVFGYCLFLLKAGSFIFKPAFEGKDRTGNKTVAVQFDGPLFCCHFCALGSALSM